MKQDKSWSTLICSSSDIESS